MSSYAKGTPESYIKAREAEMAARQKEGLATGQGVSPVKVTDAMRQEAAKMEAEKRAMAATAANKPGQRHVSPPVAKPVPKAIAPVVAKAQQTARNIAATRPASATGGIRASNDPSNPEIAQKLAEAKTYMQSVGKSDTGYEPSGSAYSSLAGASKPTITTTDPTLLKGPGGLQPDVGYGNRPYGATPVAPAGGVFKKGGRVKAKAKSKSSYSSGGKVSSASKRGDGCAQRGKTKGRMI